jgi:DNA-binding CsgD family transcriptional regulator
MIITQLADATVPAPWPADERQWRDIYHAFARARQRPTVLFIEGAAGSGKTSLLRLVERLARIADFAVVTSDAIEQPAECRDGSGGSIAALLIAVTQRCAADGPVAVVLDDLHTAGDQGIESLCQMVQRWRGRPVLWALAHRDRAPELVRRLSSVCALIRTGPQGVGGPPLRQTELPLSASAQDVARLGAALGDTFDACQLSHLLNSSVSRILPAIQELVFNGVLSPVRYELEFHHQPSDGQVADDDPAAAWRLLTEKEAVIAELAAAGLTNIQIAHRIGRSTHTVNFHLRQIFRKLGIHSRVQLSRLRDLSEDRPDV